MTRAELQKVRDIAMSQAREAGSSEILLMRAWTDLASAADRLDAMLARSGVAVRRAPIIAMAPTPPPPPSGVEAPPDLDFSGFEGDDGEEGVEYQP